MVSQLGALLGGACRLRLAVRTDRSLPWYRLFSTVGCLVTYSMFTACSAVFNSSGSSAAGNGAVAMIFVYSGFYDVAYSVFYYT